MPEPVYAISTARNNAELIAQCAQLGYLRKEWWVLDPTYGRGRFWTKWYPDTLIGSDINPAIAGLGDVDFRDIPYPEGWFDAVVLDGPYKLNGTSTGRGPSAADADYGVDGQYVSWQDRHKLINEGIVECVRVLKPGGMLLVKCQDQVCSGKVRWQTLEFSATAIAQGCELVDMLHLVGSRAQPVGRTQQHARRNYSTLLVLQKDTAR